MVRSALAIFAFVTTAWTTTAPSLATAQNYPMYPIKIIVATAVGGPLDTIGRAVADKLTESLKQPVVIESRSGAGGNIAASFVSKSRSDGYTLLFAVSSTLTVNPHLYKDLAFNLRPITVVNYSTNTLFVHPSLPVKNLGEFVDWAKREGPITYGHSGNGSPANLMMEFFRFIAGFKTVPVPYRGISSMVADFIEGRFKATFGSTAALLPLAAAGKLRPIAISTPTRMPLIPEVPTVAESGYPGFQTTFDFTLFAPREAPDEIVAFLEREVRKAIITTDFKERFAAQDLWVVASTAKEAEARIDADFKLWGDVIRRTGMKID